MVLHVRRFFCDNAGCTCRIFTERLPAIASAWARRTRRMADAQRQIGLVAGGSAGAALCTALGGPAGIDVLLALVRQVELPESPTPRVLGVDVLGDRTPETLAQWLREHPGVEIVTRDRPEAYAQISQGAPTAIQVAHRWHLLKNLTDAMTKVLQDHHREIERRLSQVVSSAAPQTVPASQRLRQQLGPQLRQRFLRPTMQTPQNRLKTRRPSQMTHWMQSAPLGLFRYQRWPALTTRKLMKWRSRHHRHCHRHCRQHRPINGDGSARPKPTPSINRAGPAKPSPIT